MAVRGIVPASICPVIIPGRETIPIPTIVLRVGSIAPFTRWRAKDSGVALPQVPMHIRAFIFARWSERDSLKALTPRETPVMVFPIIIPDMGMTY